ncbi:MAG: hypothetical protein OXG07_03620 [Anaerolineaceae bacterium]|nr:hypothetical protein [Anaerolineaceae bacterium]MCY3906340.1 hypothetical protein [Anaerolineaceae bacterium]MDE0330135.1 hypothetical protein [Anaerolineaceae bacterium]
MELLILPLIWLVCGIVAGNILANRGQSRVAGCLLGSLLGPIGLAIALFVPDRTKK